MGQPKEIAMTSSVAAAPSAYLATFSRVLERVEVTTGDQGRVLVDEGIGSIVAWIVSLKERSGKALLIGNGGSAAIASHVQNDFCKALGVRALVFNEPPLLTAIANDDGFHDVFRRPIDLWADRDDLLIAISSSGQSENVVTAAAHAKERGCRVVTFTGFSPANRLRQVGTLNIYVPASTYGYVEMAHSVIAHCLIDFVAMRSTAPI
jgi:D-sedoheptulose 7-phosphate isomerase